MWGTTLGKMLEDKARYMKTLRAEAAKRGREHIPPDPADPFIELAERAARGENVAEAFQKMVLGRSPEK